MSEVTAMGDSEVDGVTIEVGAVVDTAHGRNDDATDRVGQPETTGGSGSAPTRRDRWPRAVAVAVAVVAVVGGLVAWQSLDDESGDVTTSTVFRANPVPAPDAPDRLVARRWFSELPTNTSMLGLAVTDDVVVAQVKDLRDLDAPASSVQSWARLDGAVAWTTTLDPLQGSGGVDATGPPLVVLVTDPSEHVVTVTNETLASVPSPGIVAVDATDGSIAWTTALGRDGWVEVVAGRDRGLVHYTDSEPPRTEVVDLHSGAVMHSHDQDVTPIEGGWLRGDLAAGTSWDLLADDGGLRTTIQSDARPLVVTGPDEELVVALDGTDLVATTMDGAPAWTIPLPGTEPIPATEVDVALALTGDGMVLAGAYRSSDNEVGRLEDYVPTLVSATGTPMPLDSPVVTELAAQVGLTTITVDGTPLLACRRRPTGGSDACPADLALVGLDGSITAQVDDVTVQASLLAPLPHFGLATRPGLVVREDDVLRLRQWGDLAQVWEVGLPAVGADILIAPTSDGMAIGTDGAAPGITWLS